MLWTQVTPLLHSSISLNSNHFTVPRRWMCNSIPHMQHQSGMVTAFMQTGPDGPAYCPICVSVNTSDTERKLKILASFSSCYCWMRVAVAALM